MYYILYILLFYFSLKILKNNHLPHPSIDKPSKIKGLDDLKKFTLHTPKTHPVMENTHPIKPKKLEYEVE